MKKITIIYFVLIIALPVLLQAQYGGGNGRGDVMLESLNNPLTNTGNNNLTIPASYSLSQNYPNPFNPTTEIRYDLPRAGFVKLSVFDVTGKEVETLVNEKQSAGTYETIFNASQLPSGMYFYRLTTDGFKETKSMLMVK